MSRVGDGILTGRELEELAAAGRPISIMMGQTFDDGQPIDLLKYALVLMNLQEELERAGNAVRCTWVIADHFIVEINRDQDEASARLQVDERIDFLERLNRTYGGRLEFALSSELSRTERYRAVLAKLLAEADSNPDFRERALRAVPEDRRDNPGALVYPFEEMATIASMDADVKVGPPYERFYDEPARGFGPAMGLKKFIGIYLTRCYPFGDPRIEPELAAEIERFGILPYKKGSKGLGDFRIDPLNDPPEAVEALLRTTTDPRALTDLAALLALAQARRPGDRPAAEIGDDQVRAWAESPGKLLDLYREHIAEPLASGLPSS